MIDALSAEVAASGRSLEEQRALLARARIPSVETGTGRDVDAADGGAALQIRWAQPTAALDGDPAPEQLSSMHFSLVERPST